MTFTPKSHPALNGEAEIETRDTWISARNVCTRKTVPARITAKRVSIYSGLHAWDRQTFRSVRSFNPGIKPSHLLRYRLADEEWVRPIK